MTTKKYTPSSPPSFKGRRVYVLPGSNYAAAIRMFARHGLKKAKDLDDADIVCFLGGSDVDPNMYNERRISETRSIDKSRDRAEESIYHRAVEKGLIMFGICRGAQFLHVMNGGSLWQHVDNHAGEDHLILDLEEDVTLMASSTHHQMMADNESMTLLATTPDDVANIFKNQDHFINRHAKPKDDVEEYITLEVEACYYPETKCLCIQGHPETGPNEFTNWSMNKLHDFTIEWEPRDKTIAREVLKQIG